MGVRRASRFAVAALAAVSAVVIVAVVRRRPLIVRPPQPFDTEELGAQPPMPVAPALVARFVSPPGPPGNQDAEDAPALIARQVITQSRAAYAACETYEDHGRHDTSFRVGSGWSEETEFHTVFAGPGAVRVAYRDLATEYLPDRFTQLVVDDAGVEEITPWGGERRAPSLADAVGGLAGVSHGISIAVLPLLPSGPEELPSVLDLPHAEAIGTEDVDGEPCDILSGTRTGDHVRIWIAQSDSLVRRVTVDTVMSAEEVRKMEAPDEADLGEAGLPTIEVDVERDAEGLSTFQLTTFHPTCGHPIPPSALRLTDGSL